MAVLHAAQRNALPASSFGLPAERKNPMPNKSHARNALARVVEAYHRGKISASGMATVRAKANRVLGRDG